MYFEVVYVSEVVYVYVSFIGLRSSKTRLTLINRTRFRTRGQYAGCPQAHFEITSKPESFQCQYKVKFLSFDFEALQTRSWSLVRGISHQLW